MAPAERYSSVNTSEVEYRPSGDQVNWHTHSFDSELGSNVDEPPIYMRQVGSPSSRHGLKSPNHMPLIFAGGGSLASRRLSHFVRFSASFSKSSLRSRCHIDLHCGTIFSQ